MDIFFFFLIAGITLVVLILKFDKKQSVKMNTVLRQSRAVPPMFMLNLTEKKIESLKAALRYDDVPRNMADAGTMADIYNTGHESLRLSKVLELKLISAKYNDGLMSIDAFNAKLDELLDMVQVQGNLFQLAC